VAYCKINWGAEFSPVPEFQIKRPASPRTPEMSRSPTDQLSRCSIGGANGRERHMPTWIQLLRARATGLTRFFPLGKDAQPR